MQGDSHEDIEKWKVEAPDLKSMARLPRLRFGCCTDTHYFLGESVARAITSACSKS